MLTAPKICRSNSLLPSEDMNTQFIRPDATMSVNAAPALINITRNRMRQS